MTIESSRPLAVVTGASSGIGYFLAEQFADHDFDLVVAAEDAGIAPAAAKLKRSGGVVTPVRVNLSIPHEVEELHRVVRETRRPLEAAVLNAGIGAGGAFATDTDLAKELEIVDLNVRSTVHLAKLVVG